MASITETIQRCAVSRAIRTERYGWLRIWFQRGTDMVGPPARHNKLKTHLRLVTSYLYAPESARFSLTFPADQRKRFRLYGEVARDEIAHHWRQSGADVLWKEMTMMSLVYGAVVTKILPVEHSSQLTYLFPGDFGVLREDVASLDKQEVIVHWSYLSLSEVAQLVKGHPQEKQVMEFARSQSVPGVSGIDLPQQLQQVIATSIQGTFPNQTITGITNLTLVGDERAMSEEPIVEIAEVWEKADFKSKSGHQFVDWLVTTVIGDWPILERRNPVLPYVHSEDGPPLDGDHPFIMISPTPSLDYLWGESELNSLIQLQQWRETRMNQLDRLFELQMDPPRLFSGIGLPDEKLNALRKAGSMVSTAMPNAKMDTLKPEMPGQPLDFLHEIDRLFSESGSTPEILQGSNQQGVRAGEQVSAIANIAVGRIRSQALVIEDALEVAATKSFYLMQRHDPTHYPLPDGSGSFLMAELPVGTIVKVDAHSASPVYAEQTKQDAYLLHKSGAIDSVTLVELVNPPMMEALRDQAKDLQEQKSKLMAEKLSIEREKAQRRGSR